MLSRIQARPGETLATHTVAVVRQLQRLQVLHPMPAFPRLYSRLHAAAWLHDSGKLAQGFQRGLGNPKQRWGLRHEVLSLGFVHWLSLAEIDRPWVLAAIATHHRDISFILETYRSSARMEQLLETLTERDALAWHGWLAAQGLPLRSFEMLHATHIKEALCELDAWWTPLESQGFEHPMMVEVALLRGLMIQADHAAAAQIGTATSAVLDEDALAQQTRRRLYPHQRRAGKTDAETVVLVAPTGSGKTEAGLLWARRMNSPRLYYALPYRASMNAMQRRLQQVSPQVGLQHGRALSALYQQALDEGLDERAAQRTARAKRNLARLHALPVRVFSPYHLLRLTYQFKGFEAGLADAYGASLIVDEIHAYQPERLALILETLRFLRDYFCLRLCVMTATLPPVVEARLRETLPGAQWIQATPGTFRRFQRHRIHRREGDLLERLEPIIAEALSGLGVLITVNTVRRALALAHAVEERGLPWLLLHGRFAARDRWRIEQEIQQLFASRARRRRRRSLPIVISTQVIEVSLDVDFDVLHSDPAPLDALIQRFGRVNRARRQRELARVNIYSQPTGAGQGASVYDPALVEASLAVLHAHDGQAVDESQVGEWLGLAYQDVEGWQDRYTQKVAEFQRVIAELRPLESADRGLMLLFSRLFDELRVLPLDLEDEYRARLEENPIDAEGLLVSLSWRQYKMLERDGRAWRGEGEDEALFFVDAPYSMRWGLDLYRQDEEE